MFSSYMWVYPWDVRDEGIDPVLDQMQEMGVSGVSMATIYHSIEHVQMHAALAGGGRVYEHRGAAYFQPDESKYANTRLRPIVADWLGSENPLAELGQACQRADLSMRSWTVCCHNSEMVRQYPDAAIKNAFGDVNPTWMCPLNPDVGEYIRAAADDLSSNYPFEAIELESPAFNAARHYHTHVKMGLEPGEAEQFLLALCFCESCRQGALSAGIDVDPIVRAVQAELEKWFADAQPSAESIDELIGRVPSLGAFVTWRTGQLSEYIRRIRSTCKSQLVVYAEPNVYGSAFDLAALRDDVDLAVGTCYSKTGAVTAEAIEQTVNWLSDAIGGIDRLSIGLMTYPPAAPDGPSLGRQIHRVAELGVPAVHLYHYGIMPDPCLTWTKQALRRPRRES
jgi:hypothetical protein